MKKIRLSLKDRSYDIVIGHGLIKRCGVILKRLNIGKDAVIVTNKTLEAIYKKPLEASLKKASINVRFELVPDSEKAKSFAILTRLLSRISRYDKTRKIFIVAFGGGVIGDLAGFAASIYKRGVPYVQIPSTLLAEVDSAIGGKVAVDLPIAKNLAGSFYQPKIVLSDTALLRTLPRRQIRNGLAEIIKYAIIEDVRLFEYLEKNCDNVLGRDARALEFVVARCSAIKARIVEKDEFDNKSRRVALNYGHTIGHAIETAARYSKNYNHGEAIAIGMVTAAYISLKLGLIKKEDVKRIEGVIKRSGLPLTIRGLKLSDIYSAHLHDKKFIHGKNRFVLPTAIGRVRVVEDVPEYIVKRAIKERMGQ